MNFSTITGMDRPTQLKRSEGDRLTASGLSLGAPLRSGVRIEGKPKVVQSMIELPLDGCANCPLNTSPSIKHNYRGPVPAKVMILGEFPSFKEEKVGDCWKGRPGKMLSAVLEEAGIEESEVFFANVVMCHPIENRKLKSPEQKACRGNIEAIIKAVQPEVLIPLGNPALKWLTKRSGVMMWHGTKMESDYGTVIPAIHPSFVLRQGGELKPKDKEEQRAGMRGFMLSDFEYIKSVLDGSEEDFSGSRFDSMDYKLISTIEDLDDVFEEISHSTDIAVDIETTGLTFYTDDIIGISFSWREGQAVYIPLLVKLEDLNCELFDGDKRVTSLSRMLTKVRSLGLGLVAEQEEDHDVHPVLAEWRSKRKKRRKRKGARLVKFWGGHQKDIEDLISCILQLPGKRWFGWNFKFDEKFLMTHYRTGLFKIGGDGIYQSFLLDENTPNDLKSNTDYLVPDLRGYANELRRHTSQSELDGEKLANVKLDVLYKYGCGDADATRRLVLMQEAMLRQDERLDWYYRSFYLPLEHVYVAAEVEGILVDSDWVTEVAIDLVGRIRDAEKKMFAMCGYEFNPRSSDDLNKVFYGPGSVFQVDIPTDKHLLTDSGGPSTKELVLKWMFYQFPIESEVVQFIRLLLEHKKLSKQMSTYIVGCTELLDEFGCAHFSTNLIGAVTGRMSAKKIPIQTIPRDSKMRGMFMAHKGWRLIEADYSTEELRIAAWYSRDPTMNYEFKTGADPHRNTGADIFKCDPEDVTKQQRKFAKSTNFGSLYEGSPRTLADSINDKIELDETPVTVRDAEKFARAWAKRYRGYVAWRRKVHAKTKKDGQVKSPLGRIRRLPAINSDDQKDRAEAQRQGPNSLIQGLGSDIGQLALIRILRRFKENGLHGRFKFPLHDANFFEVPDCEVLISCKIIKEEMERNVVEGLFTPVEMKIFKDRWAGDNWELEIKSWDQNWADLEEVFLPLVNEPIIPFETKLTDCIGSLEVSALPTQF